MSSSVIRVGSLATLPISVWSGSPATALSKAARLWARDVLPSPSRIRATTARCAARFSSIDIESTISE
jgi:hypothetical protein